MQNNGSGIIKHGKVLTQNNVYVFLRSAIPLDMNPKEHKRGELGRTATREINIVNDFDMYFLLNGSYSWYEVTII